jgi:hypothetical protein
MSAPVLIAAIFNPGRIVATPGAIEATNLEQRLDYLRRHLSGDFGCVCTEDAETNREAIRDGFRILSAYPIDPGKPSKGYGENCIWIITEADRSATTFLLPSEY